MRKEQGHVQEAEQAQEAQQAREVAPTLRVLSLGAGVQSTTVLMLAAEGRIPTYDAAIFSDTGWEPQAVYDHLDRLEERIAKPAGIPILRVSSGNIREDALDPEHRFASMPLYVKNPDGGDGMTRRQCTSEYKLKPIKEAVRRLLGAPDEPNQSGRIRPGRVPTGRVAEQSIGISLDELHRAKDSDVGYVVNTFPLLDLKWDRKQCERYLRVNGWGSTPKSACIGCPFHGNAAWRKLRDETPDEWADAVDFDRRIRAGHLNPSQAPLLGEAYLHRSRLPLDQAPIDRRTSHEQRAMQGDLVELLLDDEADVEQGCSPWTCRSDGRTRPRETQRDPRPSLRPLPRPAAPLVLARAVPVLVPPMTGHDGASVTCGRAEPHRSHHGCQGVLRPADQRFLDDVAAALERIEDGPWWHQAAGRQDRKPDESPSPNRVGS